jgi:hypothetical protein
MLVSRVAVLASVAMLLLAVVCGGFRRLKVSARVWRVLDVSVELDGRSTPPGEAAIPPIRTKDSLGGTELGTARQEALESGADE